MARWSAVLLLSGLAACSERAHTARLFGDGPSAPLDAAVGSPDAAGDADSPSSDAQSDAASSDARVAPASGPCLERPESLPRPPTGELPCELLPPGLAR